MKIIELDWLMENRNLLVDEDKAALERYDLFHQYDDGELCQTRTDMLDVLRLIMKMYRQYNGS